jgi:hypothetical protein
MEPSHSWEAASFSPTKEFPILCNPNICYRVRKSPPLAPILSHINPAHTPNSISLRYILISFSHLCLRLPSGLFHSGFPTKILYAFQFSNLLQIKWWAHHFLSLFYFRHKSINTQIPIKSISVNEKCVCCCGLKWTAYELGRFVRVIFESLRLTSGMFTSANGRYKEVLVALALIQSRRRVWRCFGWILPTVQFFPPLCYTNVACVFATQM